MLRTLFKGAGAQAVPSPIATTFRLDCIDPRQLQRYNALLGFAPDALPISFYYLPTQRAHLATLLGQAFPFRVAGMIHVENHLSELRLPDRKQPLDLTTRVVMEAPTKSGAQYCELLTEGAQQGLPIFECRSRYLAARGKQRARSGPRSGGAAAGRTPAQPGGTPVGEWPLAADAGRRYAAVSGDWNPIHLWPWSARLLGMKTPIIHGMHTVGKACAELERQQGQRLAAISARFKAPVQLGSQAELRLAEASGSYQVWAGGNLAVEGSWR
jgi:acyl dehydratase